MPEDSLQWAIVPIHRWRDQAGNPNRVNPALLLDFLKKVEATEISSGLVFYSILACEWLFRIKKAGPEEIQNILRKIEKEFTRLTDRDLAYYLTEALRPRIEEIFFEEGRTLLSLGTHFPRKTWQERDYENDPNNKKLPEKIAPLKRGKIPHPGQWIAGLTLEFFRKEKGLKNIELPLPEFLLLLFLEPIEAILAPGGQSEPQIPDALPQLEPVAVFWWTGPPGPYEPFQPEAFQMDTGPSGLQVEFLGNIFEIGRFFLLAPI